ncbi:MAG: hypothetical protein ACRD6B_03885 [Bryobacteraceae bacterium]
MWYWAHVAVVVEDGQTIEAQGRGVVRMAVSDHPEAAVCRAVGLDRERIVAEARRRLGQPYGYRDFFFLSLDAVFGTNFSDNRLGVDICSELGIRCWIAGGYPFEGNPSDVAPSDIAMLVPLGPRP